MKRAILILAGLALLIGLTFSQQDWKSICEKSYNDNLEVKKLVLELRDQVKKLEQTNTVKKDLADGEEWVKKADEIMEKQRARMDKGEYNQDVSIQLGYAWRYYVEAGTKFVLCLNSQAAKLKKK